MRFKRILAGAFALAITLPLLIPWAHAHPGDTDSNGGHTDHSTGSYHYHHGYEAHAHFDIDGNGTIDCPYEYVDLTGQSSGTRTSGISTPGNGTEDGYQDGYADGYKKGKLKGAEDGYEDGVADTKKDYEKQLLLQQNDYEQQLSEMEEGHRGVVSHICKFILFIALALLICIFRLRGASKRTKAVEDKYKARISEMTVAQLKRIDELDAEHEADVKMLEKEYQCRIDGLISDHQQRMSRMVADHAAEVRGLKHRLINFRRLEVLENFTSGKDKSIVIPEGIHFRPQYVPVRGRTTKRYPFGSYTVFVVQGGKKYHCKHNCTTNVHPLHFFDVPVGTTPCSKCVPSDMYPQPRPDWYIQLREKLDAVVSDQEPNVEEEVIYYAESSNGLTVRVPDSALDNVGKPAKNQLTPEVRERLKRQLKERIFSNEDEPEESDIRFSIDIP